MRDPATPFGLPGFPHLHNSLTPPPRSRLIRKADSRAGQTAGCHLTSPSRHLPEMGMKGRRMKRWSERQEERMEGWATRWDRKKKQARTGFLGEGRQREGNLPGNRRLRV